MNKLNGPVRPVVLCILDGWGEREDAIDNAITRANIPCWKKLVNENPVSFLKTSGLAVGLPEGQMGNSEVGHMSIGGGRVIMQSLPMIDMAISDGSLAKNEEITGAIAKLKKTGGTCHIMGLMSPGGVHSHQDHMAALAKIFAQTGIDVKIHAFLDGRDVPPASAGEYINNFNKDLEKVSGVEIATISGRYYAMDRDNRWGRVQKAYDAMVLAEGEKFSSTDKAIKASYDKKVFDEFFIPCVIDGYNGMKDGDAVIMANFRSDRARQILVALLDPEFKGFDRKQKPSFSAAFGMVEYSQDINKFAGSVFKPQELNNILGQVIADNGLKQLRISETEKYAHVTFFFNGGREEEFPGEKRILVPSPKVATYDLQPEMSAAELTDKLVLAIESKEFDLVVVNYANTDMVGHTGDQNAAMKAVETVDKCLARLVVAVDDVGGAMLITADHGNSEQMLDTETGQPHTSHTTNPVPFVVVGKELKDCKLKDGGLSDVAPTVLHIMGIKKPKEMTGESLICG